MFNINRVILVLVFSLIFIASSEAKSYHLYGNTKTSFNTQKPVPQYIYVDIPAQEVNLSNAVLEKDWSVKLRVDAIKEPARGKRDATILTKLVELSTEDDKFVFDNYALEPDVKIKKYSEIDFKNVTTNVVTTSAGYIFKVPMLTQGLAAVKGIVKPNDGQTRLESVGKNVYESTPLPYAEVGEELSAVVGEKITLILKFDKNLVNLDKYGFKIKKEEPDTSLLEFEEE